MRSEPFRTLVAGPLPWPALRLLAGEDGSPWVPPDRWVMVGALSLNAIGEVGLWLRLVTATLVPEAPVHLLLDVPDRREVADVFPRSVSERIVFAGGLGEWAGLDRPDRALAAIVAGSTVEVLMTGPPTERALEHFQAAWSEGKGR
jgi:hypothetical protein